VDRDTRPTPLRLLLGSQFGLYLAGNGLSLVGTWMQRIACSWLVWDWTQSVFWLGILSAADLLPAFVIGPFAGVAADRWDRLRQNRIAQMASALIAGLTAVLLLADALGLAGVVLSVAAQGVLSAAIQPARLAMVQQMVAREDMAAAVALNSVTVNLARLVGPALAGAMILYMDLAWVFVANAAVTALFVLVLARLRVGARASTRQPRSFMGDLLAGFAFIARTRALWLILLVMLCGGAIVRAMVELMPAIAEGSFADNAKGLAVLAGAAAAGAVVSGLAMSAGRSTNLLTSVLLWWGIGGAAAMVLAAVASPVAAVLAAVVTGAATTRGLVMTQTFVQLSTPDELRGRVLGVHGIIARGSPALGALVIGYVADRIGLAAAVKLAGGALILALVLLAPVARRAASDLRPPEG
jgi:MFS family permease